MIARAHGRSSVSRPSSRAGSQTRQPVQTPTPPIQNRPAVRDSPNDGPRQADPLAQLQNQPPPLPFGAPPIQGLPPGVVPTLGLPPGMVPTAFMPHMAPGPPGVTFPPPHFQNHPALQQHLQHLQQLHPHAPGHPQPGHVHHTFVHNFPPGQAQPHTQPQPQRTPQRTPQPPDGFSAQLPQFNVSTATETAGENPGAEQAPSQNTSLHAAATSTPSQTARGTPVQHANPPNAQDGGRYHMTFSQTTLFGPPPGQFQQPIAIAQPNADHGHQFPAVNLMHQQMQALHGGQHHMPVNNQGTPHMPVHNTSGASTVYLLSSPSGPHALVYQPDGVFGSAFFHAPPVSAISSRIMSRSASSRLRQGGIVVEPATAAGGNAPQGERAADEVVVIGAAGVQDARQPEPDLLAQIQPILGQVWFLLRIMLFAYFLLGHGPGWHRPIGLACLCIGFLILRNADVGTQLREALRSWWEGVVGINRAPRADGQGPPLPQQPQQHQAAAQGRAQAVPVPAAEPAAEARANGWQRHLHMIQRALALFVASLWPGVGEHTVRARREMEEREQRHAREIEEAAERERLQAVEDQAPPAPESGELGNAKTGVIADGLGESSAAAVSTGVDSGASGSMRERNGHLDDVQARPSL